MVLQWKIIGESENIFLKFSKNISAFSYVAFSFLKVHRIETVKNLYLCLDKISAAGHLYFSKSILVRPCIRFHRSPFISVPKFHCSNSSLLSNHLAIYFSVHPNRINFKSWIQHQDLPELPFPLFDSSWLVRELRFPTFQIPLMEYFRFENQINQCKIYCFAQVPSW